MARIFSIDFELNQLRYNALVNYTENKDGHQTFTVSAADEHIEQLMPNGKISITNLEEILAGPKTDGTALLHSLVTAIHQKLHSEGVITR